MNVYVGSCASASRNIECNEIEDASLPTVSICPANTYGRYVTFIREGTSVQLKLCEIIIHGKDGKFRITLIKGQEQKTKQNKTKTK